MSLSRPCPEAGSFQAAIQRRKHLSPAIALLLGASFCSGCQQGTPPAPSDSKPEVVTRNSSKPPAPPTPHESQLDINHPLTFGVEGGKPHLTRCSERIVEIPFTLRQLPYPFRGRVLDVGYRESEITFQTASLGFETWGIDIRPPLVEYPGVRYVQGDIRDRRLPEAYFDVVIALSTVEHIGLIFYGNDQYSETGDVDALRAIRRVLKQKGRLILTVPFGTRGATDWYRVYDFKALNHLLSSSGFRTERQNFWRQEGVGWVPTSWQEGERVDSVTDKVKGVACIVARPITPLRSLPKPLEK